MGHGNQYSSEEGDVIEYSIPVTIGLETTWYMPGYAQGNPIYQALLDYAEEAQIEVQVTFFDNSVDMLQQMRDNTSQGIGPDLVLLVKQFSAEAPESWHSLLANGVFEDLSPYLQLDSQQYYETVLQSGQYEEQQYLVPFCLISAVLSRRRNFYRRWGKPSPQSRPVMKKFSISLSKRA